MRLRHVILSIVAVIAIALAGCGDNSSGGSSSGGGDGGSASRGFLRIGDANSRIDSTNPFVSVNFFGLTTFRYNYPYLVEYDAENENVVGSFARAFSTSDDGITWTYDLHPDAQWSDGKPLTSADAKWTFDTILRYKDGPTALLAGHLVNVETVEAPAPDQLVIRFKKPAANGQSLLVNVPILPRHVWEQHVGTDGRGLLTWENPAPLVSGGPYILEQHTPDVSLIFRANPKYWGPTPSLSGFGVQFFGSPDAMVTALRQGELDVALEVPQLTLDALDGQGGVTVASPAGPGETAILINSNPKKPDHPELQNPKVRQAISMALDREKLVEVVTDGAGVEATTLIPPTVPKWSAQSELPPLSRDVDAANALLDELGFRRGADGIRVADGERMSYVFNYCACYGDRTQAIVKESLEAIGIELKVQSADAKAFIAAYGVPDGQFLEYDLGLWDDQARPDPTTMLATVTCEQRGNSNFSYYCNPAYERLYEQQALELDEARRREIVIEMQRLIREEAPWIPLYDPAVPVAWRDNVRDFRPSGLIINFLSTSQLTDVSVSG